MFKKRSSIELIIDVSIGDQQVYFTGDLLQQLIKLYNAGDHFYLVVDLVNKSGHCIAKSEQELLSITKLNLNSLKKVLSHDLEKVKFKILTESELSPLINMLVTNQRFNSGLDKVEIERFIRYKGEQAFREAQLLNYKRGLDSYSLNSDPNIRRFRVEQEYRRMLRKR